MKIYSNAWLFQNTLTPANGNSFQSGHNDQMTIYITGDSTSRTIYFEGADDNDNWFSIPAVKLPELSTSTSTTGNNEVWVINLAHWVYVRCRVSAVSGGTVKITGRVVDVGTSLINNKIVAIDESTDGTTNRVVAKISQVAGENLVQLSGSKIEESLDQSNATAGVLTFTENINSLEILNTDSVNAGTFTVNGISIKIPAGLGWGPQLIGGIAAKIVSVSGATTYIVNRYS